VSVPADVRYAAMTDAGPSRDGNEDACLALPATGGFPAHVFAVADGLGGQNAGEEASGIVVEQLTEATRTVRLDRSDRWVRQALNRANLAVYDHGRGDASAFNCQSTATAVVVEADRVTVGHIGDCRLYLVRDGGIEQCTTDHSRANEMLRLRIITPEQAAHHPARNQLTRTLGCELLVTVDVARKQLRDHDVLVLCSDGLWSEIPRAEIAAIVAKSDPGEAAETLIRTAIEREASDNVTAVVVRIEHLSEPAGEPGRRWLPWR
jgi:protein phosphatase